MIAKPTHTKTKADLDFHLLRNVICKYETRNQLYPDFAVSRTRIRKRDNKIVGGAWGRCQIMLETARLVGFSKKRSPGDLFKRSINEEFALKILKRCEVLLRTKRISPNIWNISHCYGTGFLEKEPKSQYAKHVTYLYANAFIKMRFGTLHWTEEILGWR